MIDSIYETMIEEAYKKEVSSMRVLQNMLKQKSILTEEEQEMANTLDPQTFFTLFLHKYGPGSQRATVNTKEMSYTLYDGNKYTTYTIRDRHSIAKLEEALQKGEERAAGLLFEMAAESILDSIVKNFKKMIDGQNLNNNKFGAKVSGNVNHIDNYFKDYTISLTCTPATNNWNEGAYWKEIDIEEKAKIDNFHIANARNNGILDVSDYGSYISSDGKGYGVYEYLKIKLLQEKLKNHYPIFHSINKKTGGVLTSSSLLKERYNIYLDSKSKNIPSWEELVAMARQILDEDSAIANTDLYMFDEAKTYAVDSAATKMMQNKTILNRIIKNAQQKKGIRGFSVWYGKSFKN